MSAPMIAPRKKHTTGTREWSKFSFNMYFGCKHDCLYCYSKCRSIIRFKERTVENWTSMKRNGKKIQTKYFKKDGRIMIPTTHDICDVMDEDGHNVKEILLAEYEKILKGGNVILFTMKPEYTVMTEMCDRFLPYQSQIYFRFSITTANEETAQWWEKGAPSIDERIRAMQYATDHGYRTSVSAEPFLDHKPEDLIHKVSPALSEKIDRNPQMDEGTIWIGLMNKEKTTLLRNYTHDTSPQWDVQMAKHTLDYVRDVLYLPYKDQPRILFKDSVTAILKSNGMLI